MNKVFLSLGGNIGEREKHLAKAIELLGISAGAIAGQSSLYETQPWKMEDAGYFINQVVLLETERTPQALMEAIKQVEQSLGRHTSPPTPLQMERGQGVRYQSRTIDIDILFYNNKIIHSPNLTIPHPLLHERKFVLMPMNEIAPQFIHPLVHKSIAELLKNCKDSNEVKKLN